MTTTDQILKLHDANEDVATIALALSLSPGHIYSTLRRHRPKRARKTHAKWSPYRDEVGRLARAGKSVHEIANALGVRTATVYKHLPRAVPPCPVPRPAD